VHRLSYHSKTNDGQENISHVSIKRGAAVNRTVRPGTVRDEVQYDQRNRRYPCAVGKSEAPAGDEWQRDCTNDLPVWEVNQIDCEVQNFRKIRGRGGLE
jgi:hypothetical protein